MQTLSRLAEAVLAELAADQGLRSLVPDAQDIISVEVGDVTLAMAFNTASESAFLISVIAESPVGRTDWPWLMFALGSRLAARCTRLAIEPETGQLVVIAQIALTGLQHGGFIRAMEAFIEDVRTVHKHVAGQGGPVRTIDPVEESDHFIVRL